MEFRCSFLRQLAHGLDHLPGLLAGLEAQALVSDDHEFFGVHIVDHADRRALWGIVAVVFILAVIALAADIRLSVDVAAKPFYPRFPDIY